MPRARVRASSTRARAGRNSEEQRMSWRTAGCTSLAAALAVLAGIEPRAHTQPGAQPSAKAPVADKDTRPWTDDFRVEAVELVPTGRNPYFILEPGYFMVL